MGLLEALTGSAFKAVHHRVKGGAQYETGQDADADCGARMHSHGVNSFDYPSSIHHEMAHRGTAGQYRNNS